jgi:hypothetical protein
MKKLFAPLLAVFGTSAATAPTPKVATIDSSVVLYSMPTVAADSLEYFVPTQESFKGAPQFHEDEWGQVEFFPKSRLAEIQGLLGKFKRFEQQHRRNSGWDEVFARRIERSTLVSGSDSVSRVASTLSATPGNSPILIAGSSPLGQVKSGFSIAVAPGVHLYGLKSGTTVTMLAALLSQADDMDLVRVFTKLNATEDLVLVDWRSQFMLVSVDAGGRVEMWRP